MRGAKSEEGSGGLPDPVRPDWEPSSHEVSGQGSMLRREQRPVAAETGADPAGSRLYRGRLAPRGLRGGEGIHQGKQARGVDR